MAEGTKKFPLMLVVGLIVVGLMLAAGVSYYIAKNIVGNDSSGKKSMHEPGKFIKLGDAKEGLILNVGGVNSGRYLKIGIMVELRPIKEEKTTEGKGMSPEEVIILDTVVQTLRNQKMEEFAPNKQEALKELLKSKINEALGYDRVYNVYITNFVLQ